MLSPDRPDPSGNQANQGTQTQGSPSSPALEELPLAHGAVAVAHCSSVTHYPETGPPLLGKHDNLAPPAQAVGTTALASRWEPTYLPKSVLNSIS